MGGYLAAEADDKHAVKFVFPFPALAYQQGTTWAHSVHTFGKGTGIAVTYQHHIHCCHRPGPLSPSLVPLPLDWGNASVSPQAQAASSYPNQVC